jgi:hypothetical protein
VYTCVGRFSSLLETQQARFLQYFRRINPVLEKGKKYNIILGHGLKRQAQTIFNYGGIKIGM